MVAPALQTEGKHLQSAQGIGMGSRGAAVPVLPSADVESDSPNLPQPALA
jgi:hypothetical protein